MLRVAFRLDASQAIGTGHWRRCAALADALASEGAETLFVSRPHDDVAAALVNGAQACTWLEPLAVSAMPAAATGDPPHAHWAGAGWEQDARETVRAVAAFAPGWIVVDHYAFDARWHRLVAELTGARIAVIDDLADRPLEAALLVDQNLHPDHRAKYAGRIAAGTRLLGGPRHALLARVFAEARPHVFQEEARSIGIFMGGTDPDDLTSRALAACREVAGFGGKIEVVSSATSPHHAGRLAQAARWPDTEVVSGLADLCGFFQRHDLQVGAGGGAAWERCCMAAPSVAWAIAANQAAVLPQLDSLGALHLVDAGVDPVHGIGQAVRSLLDDPRRREEMGRRARAIVDGRGSRRVAAVLALAAGPPIALRDADAGDEQLLLEWANDPAVRGQSFSPAAIPSQAHAAWFARKLADTGGSALYIAVSPAGTPVGQVRFDRSAEGWVVDYSLDAAFRGWSLAAPMLHAAIGKLALRHGPCRVIALVRAGNTASARTFRTLGFEEGRVDRQGDMCHSFRLDHAGSL